MGALVVYDITKYQSFAHIGGWIHDLQNRMTHFSSPSKYLTHPPPLTTHFVSTWGPSLVRSSQLLGAEKVGSQKRTIGHTLALTRFARKTSLRYPSLRALSYSYRTITR